MKKIELEVVACSSEGGSFLFGKLEMLGLLQKLLSSAPTCGEPKKSLAICLMSRIDTSPANVRIFTKFHAFFCRQPSMFFTRSTKFHVFARSFFKLSFSPCFFFFLSFLPLFFWLGTFSHAIYTRTQTHRDGSKNFVQ